MPITLNHSNINVQYSTGSNYIIETVKSDLYLRDSRTGISSNLTAEPTIINPSTFTERVQSFKHSGGAEEQTTYTIYFPTDTQCDMLIIGGGGSGSASHGGGGGAGAVIFMKNVTMNGDYTIKVGKGGICETPASTNAKGRKGNDTEIFKTNNISNKIVAEGGGGGGQLANANGGSGGSGGGGDAYNIAAGTGGVANAYTPILDGVTGIKYGNNGGNAFGNPGHGGGGGGAGGVGENALGANNSGNTENERAHGGVGIKSATINSVNYDFKTLFGIGVGGVVETDGFLYFGGGGGNGRWGSVNTGSEGGNGGLGGGGKGGWSTSVTTTQPLGGAGFPGVNGTGGGGGGGGDNAPLGGDGGSGIVIIRYNKIILASVGNPLSHRILDLVVYDLTKNVEYQTQQKTGVAGWRIVRYLPPNLGRWYQGNYINSTGFTIPTIGTPYNYTNEWAVPFGTFDEMFFGTFDMTYWLRCLKTSVLGTYDNALRPIISSSSSSTPYSARWFSRDSSTHEPWISINDYNSGASAFVLYGEDSNTSIADLRNAYGGMCVLVRDSTTSTTIPNPNTYTLNFPVPTTTDILERTAGRGILNNSNLILQGTYDINLTASSATIVPRTGQYLPFTATSNLSQNIAFRYHLLNPIKIPEGAQWTYSSNNANVYHLGNVGIGTTNPSYNLHVNGTIFTSTGGYTQTGLTTWTVMSDRRIKENIVKASYDKCLDNVKNIDLYSFNFKDNCVNTNDKNQLGFIAQEVQQVYPKAVEVSRMLLNTNETINDVLTLNTTQIDYTLYGAVKYLIEKVEMLEQKLEKKNTITNSSNVSTNSSNVITNSSNVITNSSNSS